MITSLCVDYSNFSTPLPAPAHSLGKPHAAGTVCRQSFISTAQHSVQIVKGWDGFASEVPAVLTPRANHV